jgi:hypothetical protein
MAEIKHRQVGGGPGIAYAEIYIAEDSDWGTGSYTTIFEAQGLPPRKTLMSAMFNMPQFQITVTANVNGVVAVMLGSANPKSRARIRLPADLERARTHSLQVQFMGWRVVGALLDGNAVAVMQQAIKH